MESLKEKTAKGLFWGSINSGLQQILNLVFGIILGRLLCPADYGMIGMLTIFTAIANTLQESGFTSALTNKKDVCHDDYNAVFWFSVLCGLLMYVILFCSAPLIARFYNKPELTPLARYVFLSFLFSSTSTAHNAYLFRNMMVKQRAKAMLPALALSGLIGIAMAYCGMSYWGLATQSLVYVIIVNISFWHYSHWHPTFHIDFRPLKSMFGFSSKILITNVFTQINGNILSALLGKFYSVSEVGHYTQSNKWNTLAYYFISGTVNYVAQPVLSQVSNDKERLCSVLRKMLRFSVFLSFPALLGLALVSHELIVITITEKWIACVPLMQTLCIWGAFAPITTLYSNLLISRGKSNLFMWNTVALSLLQMTVLLACNPYGIVWMIRCFVLLNILYILVWQHFITKETGLTLFMAIRDILPFAIIGAMTTLATWLITLWISNIYILFVAKIVIGALLYAGVMKVLHVAIFTECMDFFLQRFRKKH